MKKESGGGGGGRALFFFFLCCAFSAENFTFEKKKSKFAKNRGAPDAPRPLNRLLGVFLVVIV